MDSLELVGEETYASSILGYTDLIFDPSFCQCSIFQSSSGSSSVSDKLFIQDSRFKSSFSLILKQTGVFRIQRYVFLDWNYPSPYNEGMCESSNRYFCSDVNEGHHSNAYLLHESPLDYFNTWVLEKEEERFYDWGSFCVVVTE